MLTWLNTNKLKIISFLAVALLAASFVVYYFYTNQTVPADSQNVIRVESSNDASSSDKNKKQTISGQEENPFQHKGALEEIHIQNYIHWMSHQKIKADEKWKHYLLTQERVEWLLKEVKSGDFKHEDIYVEILTKWSVGDFVSADIDHNRIWTLQGGTIGKATGVLTKEEEEEYLKKNSRKLN